MAHELLCKWLELPSNPWPPDHYALLGMEPGEGNADEIEQRVLERMESLRHYQLMHPDVVTEGMNLLAQAMISLTDPSAREQYRRDLEVESNGAESAAESDQEEEVEEIEDEEELPEPTRVAAPPAPPPSARVSTWPNLTPLPSEAADQSGEDEPLPNPITILELDDEQETPEDPDDEESSLAVPSAILEEEKIEEADVERDKRRRRYREIVRVRRVIEVWGRLLEFLQKAARTFSRRTDTVAFMNCLADLRPLIGYVSDLIGGPNKPGNLIASLAKQQLVVEMFRSFLPSQREALAEDCRRAYVILTDHYRQLGRDVRRLTSRGFQRRVLYPLYRNVARRPEWLFLFLGILALIIAFARSLPR
jgi:hypothetical protein